MTPYIEFILHSQAYDFGRNGAIRQSEVTVRYTVQYLEFEGQWNDLLAAGVVTADMQPQGRKRKSYDPEAGAWLVKRSGCWYTVRWWHQQGADGRLLIAA